MTTTRASTAPQQANVECCMCGDYGLSQELFQCKLCHFRSQHRYCSDLYPKADSYQVCNWCLNNKDETAEKAQNVSNSSPSSSCKTSSEDESKNKLKRNGYNSNNSDNYQVGIKGQRGSLQLPVKKQRSPEQSPPVRKRIITTGRLEEKLRRTKSEEISHRGITRQLIRNKVRRYKLLDEVSS